MTNEPTAYDSEPNKTGDAVTPVMENVTDNFIPYLAGAGPDAWHGVVPTKSPWEDPNEEDNPFKVKTYGDVSYEERPPDEAVISVKVVNDDAPVTIRKWHATRWALSNRLNPILVLGRNPLRKRVQFWAVSFDGSPKSVILAPSADECYNESNAAITLYTIQNTNPLILETEEPVYAGTFDTVNVYLQVIEEYEVEV